MSTQRTIGISLLPITDVSEIASVRPIGHACRKSQFVRETLIVRDTSIMAIMVSHGAFYECTLVINRILSDNTDEPTHGISSIQCILRATQYLDAFNFPDSCIIGTSIEPWHIIHIYPHRRGIGPTAYSSQVYGCVLRTAIRWDEESRYNSSQITDIVYATRPNILFVKTNTGNALLSQGPVFFYWHNNSITHLCRINSFFRRDS